MTDQPTAPSPPEAGTGAGTAGYLGSLIAAAAPDVRRRLAEIGEFVITEENLPALRQRQLRDPGHPAPGVEHLDLVVPGAPEVAVRLHRERGADGPRPCLVSLHGGGYVIGTHRGDDGRFDRWARELRCVGISVGYRLAPDTPTPGPSRTATRRCAGRTGPLPSWASTPTASP